MVGDGEATAEIVTFEMDPDAASPLEPAARPTTQFVAANAVPPARITPAITEMTLVLRDQPGRYRGPS